jgi:hypothetical protein
VRFTCIGARHWLLVQFAFVYFCFSLLLRLFAVIVVTQVVVFAVVVIVYAAAAAAAVVIVLLLFLPPTFSFTPNGADSLVWPG